VVPTNHRCGDPRPHILLFTYIRCGYLLPTTSPQSKQRPHNVLFTHIRCGDTRSPQIIVVRAHVPTSYHLHAFGVGVPLAHNVPTIQTTSPQCIIYTHSVWGRRPHKSSLWAHTSPHLIIYMHSVWVPLAPRRTQIQTTSPQCIICTHSVWVPYPAMYPQSKRPDLKVKHCYLNLSV